jgi:hypothetical protein
MLWSAETIGCILIAIAGKFDWESVNNLELALYLCMTSPNCEAMGEAWKDVILAFKAVSADLDARSAEQLAQERERTAQEREKTRKATSDAVAAERQTHNWLWKVFH